MAATLAWPRRNPACSIYSPSHNPEQQAEQQHEQQQQQPQQLLQQALEPALATRVVPVPGAALAAFANMQAQVALERQQAWRWH